MQPNAKAFAAAGGTARWKRRRRRCRRIMTVKQKVTERRYKMKIPEFTAESSLGATSVQRPGLNQDSQFRKDAIIPQFMGLRASMQFQRCSLVCLPHPGGA